MLNNGISSIEDADLLLLIGSNPRYEAPLVNTRIRKSIIHNELRVAVLGPQSNLTYDYDYLGDSAATLQEILNGSHKYSAVRKYKNFN